MFWVPITVNPGYMRGSPNLAKLLCSYGALYALSAAFNKTQDHSMRHIECSCGGEDVSSQFAWIKE